MAKCQSGKWYEKNYRLCRKLKIYYDIHRQRRGKKSTKRWKNNTSTAKSTIWQQTLINGCAHDSRVSVLNTHVKWHQQLKQNENQHQHHTHIHTHNNDRHVE